jgi:arabinosyltransferase A
VPAHRIARLIAVIAGMAGVVLCGLVPLLPVTQTTATIAWPQAPGPDGLVTDITAPLVSGAPQALDVAIPCRTIASMPPGGGVVLSTNPPGGIQATRNGLFVTANADSVVVAFRDSVAAVAPRPAVASGACSTLHVWANPGGLGADFIGIPGATGTLAAEKKPQVTGLFTDLKVAAQPGLSARIDVDTRFITSPTALKLGVMVLGVICVIASIVALAVLDFRSRSRGDIWPELGRRYKFAWLRFWRANLSTWIVDIGVVGTLLLWHLIGATSSDDGYNLTIARVSADAGYAANYYRFFGATEAPFDWYQSVLAHMAAISTASVWMRLPATAAAVGTWLIISRCVLPRVGRRLANNRVAVWTAGAVFLAAWLPFNNGLRPEPLIAFGALVAWVLIENTIATRRLWPAGVAIVVAVFSVTLAPQGLIALAPLLVGARAVAGVVRSRRGVDGILAQVAPLAASLALIFVVVFRDQTLATVAESARIKYKVGPTIPWYQDFLRYYFLTVEDSADSSLTRRFAVLVLLVCLFGMLAVLLRRGGVPGMARGPVWRLIGATAVGLLLLTFTPTKWAVQFGAFAGLAGALGGVAAFAFTRVGLHSRRNLALYVTALLFVLAWATSGINGWFYVGNYGVPWFDKQPVIVGIPVTGIFLALAIVTGLLAGWLHFRMDYTGHTEVANTRRNRVLASTPLLVVAVIMVVLEVGSMAKGAAQRYPVYTTAKANTKALAGLVSRASDPSCAMADDVLVEPDANAGLLQPVPDQRVGQYGPLGGESPVGFTPNGVSDVLEPAEPVTANPGTVNSPGSPNEPNIGIGYAAGTGGGYGPVGVNGSNAFLPFGLDPKRTPVMGSYNENTVAAKVTSAWYQLPPRTPDRPLVTVAAAGAIWYYEEDGSFNYGQSLKLEWGVHRPDGSYQPLGQVQPIDIFPQ